MEATSERLILRSPRPEDWPGYLALVQSQGAMAWGAFGYQRPQTTEEAIGSFAKFYLPPNAGSLAVILPTTERLIGVMTASKQWIGTWECGYLFHPDFWHHGYATEALRLELDYLFTSEKAPYVFAEYVQGNDPSRRVLARLGMKPEGTARCGFLLRGELRDLCRVGLTRAEWQALQAPSDN
ncbi:GNAT family N-acetyltransferase [Lacticaseibacillus parakribbianus]|uniref:GNAT family N-acetyltransferase n=1 Tax=Lacticaseibacillus parakribbianus TaxID=2970927 RepID=UPI0021CB44A1|nr:GNAT family N-acetyltransferase [Lacticaseibacillus parakribbianus]